MADDITKLYITSWLSSYSESTRRNNVVLLILIFYFCPTLKLTIAYRRTEKCSQINLDMFFFDVLLELPKMN